MIDVLGGISSPVVQSSVVGALGVLALVCKRWRAGIALVAAAAVWLWLCATPSFALVMWRGLANQYPPTPPADYPHADAIVLVGGGPLPRPLDAWNATTDPALTTPVGMALALYRDGKAKRIAISAGRFGTAPLANALIRQGVAPAALELTSKSHSTHEDALYLTPLLHQAHASRILLVATGMHMPRTAASFRHQDFDVIPAPAYHRARIARLPHSLWPHRAALYLSGRCLHEYIGLFYYRLRGWAGW